MSIELGELSNGVALTQVTTDAIEKSNIYCELPYCSADSRVFVYEQKISDTTPNTTEYIACEFGTLGNQSHRSRPGRTWHDPQRHLLLSARHPQQMPRTRAR